MSNMQMKRELFSSKTEMQQRLYHTPSSIYCEHIHAMTTIKMCP